MHITNPSWFTTISLLVIHKNKICFWDVIKFHVGFAWVSSSITLEYWSQSVYASLFNSAKARRMGYWEIAYVAISLTRRGDYLPSISLAIQTLNRFPSLARGSFHQPWTWWFLLLTILKLPFSSGRFPPHLLITYSICFVWSRGD